MPQGRRNLTWLFDWIAGRGAQHDSYIMAPVLQPVADVSVDWPLDYQVYTASPQTGGAGTIQSLPSNPLRQRIWTSLELTCPTDPVTVTLELWPDFLPSAALFHVLWSLTTLGSMAGNPIAIIGGGSSQINIATATQARLALQPALKSAYQRDPDYLRINIAATTNLDILSIKGRFIDRPIYEPLPHFLF